MGVPSLATGHQATVSHSEGRYEEHSKEQGATTANRNIAVEDVNANVLPKGYFRSAFFIGTMLALCFNLAAGVGGYALLAPVLGQVNADIGPDPNIIWVALTYTLGLSVGLALVGRLSDLFGRRYFFIGGNVLGLIGCIICCTAKTVPVLIGGETLIGLASSTGASYAFVLGEIVPFKYRFAGSAFAYLWQLPTSGFGAATAYYFILKTSAGWRWCYYYLIIWNFLALVLFVLFYFPPTFKEKHEGDTVWNWAKNFDYLGAVLFAAGMVLFLMGLTWGGNVHPWRSASVIATIVSGGLTLVAFFLWEIYAKPKEPFMPLYFFKSFPWVASILLISTCGGVFYSFAIVWPQMVVALYSSPDDPMDVGYMSSLVATGIISGEVTGCFVAKPLGKTKYQIIAASILSGTLLACKLPTQFLLISQVIIQANMFLKGMATCDENTKSRAIGLLFMGAFFIGWENGIAVAITTIEIPDQRDIGIATGIMGSLRSTMGSICAAIYTAVLTNRLADEIPAKVIPAITEAGLPVDSVPVYLLALTTRNTALFNTVEGITPSILSAGATAYRLAATASYRTVFLTTIAFSGISFICAWFTPNVDHRMTNEVAAVLHRSNKRPEVMLTKDDAPHSPV